VGAPTKNKETGVYAMFDVKKLAESLLNTTPTELESLFSKENESAVKEEQSGFERIVRDGIYILSYVRFYKLKEGIAKASSNAEGKGRKRKLDRRYAFIACSFAKLALLGFDASLLGGEHNYRKLLSRLFTFDKADEKNCVTMHDEYTNTISQIVNGTHKYNDKEGKEVKTTIPALSSDTIMDMVFPPNKAEVKKKKSSAARAKKLGWNIKKFDGKTPKQITEMVGKWWKENELSEEDNQELAYAIRDAILAQLPTIAQPTPMGKREKASALAGK
jgi:hypothetical protein